MNSFDLSGRSAVVTGGGQGIGEGIAKNLAAAGASVIVAARHVDRIERVAREINVAGGTAIAMATDVTDTAAVEALADAALDEFGGLHVWVNNAGGSPVRTSLSEIGDNEWETCLQLNLTAVWKGAVVAFERMKSGAIINITSPAGEVAVPGSGHYGAAKAGVNSLTKTLSLEFAPNVRVNGIAPGFVATKMTKVTTDDPDRLGGALAKIPLGRMGDPSEMAGAALLLASPLSSYILGQTLVVDGGLTLG